MNILALIASAKWILFKFTQMQPFKSAKKRLLILWPAQTVHKKEITSRARTRVRRHFDTDAPQRPAAQNHHLFRKRLAFSILQPMNNKLEPVWKITTLLQKYTNNTDVKEKWKTEFSTTRFARDHWEHREKTNEWLCALCVLKWAKRMGGYKESDQM